MTWKAENAISETLYFMNFQGTMPLDPPLSPQAARTFGACDCAPPPQINLTYYGSVYLDWIYIILFVCPFLGKFRNF